MHLKQKISKDLSLVFDGILLGLCLWGCYLLRLIWWIYFNNGSEIPPFSQSYWMLVVIIPGIPLLLDVYKFYENPLTQSYHKAFLKTFGALFWAILLIGIISIFGRLDVPTRSVLLLFLFIAPNILIFRFWITKKYLIYCYKNQNLSDQSVIIGTNRDILAFLESLNTAEKMELQITCWYDLNQLDAATIKKSIHYEPADRIIFVSPDSPKNGDLAFDFESEGIEVWIQASNINKLTGIPAVQSAGNNRILVFKKSVGDFWYHFFKRIMDLVGASLGLILLMPVSLAIATAIKITSPGPIIFKQVRSGKKGRHFTIFKFRSMVVNAPELHVELMHQNEMQGPTFKIRRDPRVTPIGEFIRRTSLDEIPQLVNVLRGEMSLVGPRPLPHYETEKIEKSAHRRRLSVKPGLTCLWQIRGRSSIDNFEEWVNLDMEYIDNASFLLDLWIIIQTIPAVLLRKGAH